MLQSLRTATMMLVVLTILTGGVYPLLVTLCAHLLLPHQADGSLIKVEGRLVGSELIGQSFSSPRYFWGRLSAAANTPYNALASGGTNLGPLHPDRERAARERQAALETSGAGGDGLISDDLTTASGSGLDPHISVAAAEYQVARVAKTRGLSEGEVRELVTACTEGKQWGLWGEPRVNVLQLNLTLDQTAGGK